MPKSTLSYHQIKKLFSPYIVVNQKGCWIWQRGTCAGYGWVGGFLGYGRCYAHRLAYSLLYGKPPAPLCVLHKNSCNTRRCCNPKHLYAGTKKQNVRDMLDNGTHNGQVAAKAMLAARATLKERYLRRMQSAKSN